MLPFSSSQSLAAYQSLMEIAREQRSDLKSQMTSDLRSMTSGDLADRSDRGDLLRKPFNFSINSILKDEQRGMFE